jgi:hypothetical protein
MKTVFRIFGTLAVLIAILTCSLSISRANDDKKDVAAEQTQMVAAQQQLASLKEQAKMMTGESKVQLDKQVADVEAIMNSAPSETTYLIVQVLLAGLLLSALAFALFLFRPNLKMATQLLGVAAILLLAAYFVSPDIKRGEYSGIESRTAALISGIPVLIAGLFAFLVAKKNAAAQK